MERLLQPLKQEGFSEEIWKSLTTAQDAEADLLSDGEQRPSANQSPIARGTKRTADGELKESEDAMVEEDDDFPEVKIPSPPAAMPPEARADGTDEEDDEEYRPSVYSPTFR